MGGGFGGKGMWWWWGEKEGVVRRSIGWFLFWLGFYTFGGWGGWEEGGGGMGDGRWEMEMEMGGREEGGRDWGNDKVGNEWEEALWY